MTILAEIEQALDEARLTPRESIVRKLLDWYQDVLEGWREFGGGAGEQIGLSGRAWNHPSYQELERSRIRMRDQAPDLYWHLAERYIRPTTRVALRCPRCHGVEDWPKPGHRAKKHKHGRMVEMVRASVVVVSPAVQPDEVVSGVRWIAADFRCEPFVPDDLDPKEA